MPNLPPTHVLPPSPVAVPAGQFVIDKTFHEVLAGIDNRTTILLGHTRRRTRGDERIDRKNHPIRAGDVIGTHNGTIYGYSVLKKQLARVGGLRLLIADDVVKTNAVQILRQAEIEDVKSL